ncbi:hypothetical protein BGZ63DRAFT_386951 [Mariannaea sp. PMI_226]|nr:hypothetical protein BGZ63DRAFT_386951 [Mariannaea sp. PMI_226]
MLSPAYKAIFKSRVENGSNEPLTTAGVRFVEELLGADIHSPWFSPVNLDFANIEFAKHHPKKVFIYACDLDPLRDDAVIYGKCLSTSPCIQAKLGMVENENHAAWITISRPPCHSRQVKEKTLDGMAWLLNREWDREKDLPY